MAILAFVLPSLDAMLRPSQIFCLVAIAATTTLSTAHAQDSRVPSVPNVLILLCDDLGYGDLSCYGHPHIRTPNLDALAASGIRLIDCYAASAVCSSSRAGLLTGRNPNRSGIYDWLPDGIPVYLSPEEPTIPQTLADAGYRTATVGKWHLNGRFNDPAQPQPDAYGFDHWMSTQNNAAPSHAGPRNFVRNGSPVGQLEGFSCQEVADEAIRYLDATADQKSPFYLHVCFHEPHEPIASPADLVQSYLSVADNPDQAQYYANVTNMDAAAGRIIEYLDENGLRDNTLIFFTSDNGPETLKRYTRANRSYGTTGGLRGMKLHTYEGGIRVPGIISWPAVISAGRESDQPVGAVDWLPTLVDLCDAKLNSDLPLDGTSLAGFLEQDIAPERKTPLFWFYYRSLTPPKMAVRDGRWKLLASWDGPLLREEKRPGAIAGQNINPEAIAIFKDATLTDFQLFDLSADRDETSDVSGDHPEIAGRLRSQMESIFSELQREGPDWPETAAFWR